MKTATLATLVFCPLLSFAVAAQAQETTKGVEFSGSGFLTLGVGKMLGGTRGKVADFDCPCFVADYAQAGVYDGRSGLQWKPDSKLGLQGSAAFDDRRLTLTAQVVARGARDGHTNLEWLYASYRLTDNITVQAGRKRLPMFYFSDTQDVGLAMPWTHLPPQLYGWDAVNYNGVNVAIQQALGGWSGTLNLLYGNETFRDSGYWKIYNGRQSRTDVRWSNITGGDLTLQKDWLELRLIFLQSDTQTRIRAPGTWNPVTGSYDATTIDSGWNPQPAFKQRIHGIALNADPGKWLIRTELIRIDRPGQTFRDYAAIVGVGHRFGSWQPMLTYSRYWGQAVNGRLAPADDSALEGHATLALTLRYDLTATSAVKVQYDRQNDQSGPNWPTNYGNARLLSFSYDMVF